MTYLKNSRRNFLKTLTTTTIISTTPIAGLASIVNKNFKDYNSENIGLESDQEDILQYVDGPGSPLFKPIKFAGNFDLSKNDGSIVTKKMAEATKSAPVGDSVAYGIPFEINPKVICIKNEPFRINIEPQTTNWIIFMHTSDQHDLKSNTDGFFEKPFKGFGQLNEIVANYVIIFEDGTKISLPVSHRHNIGMFRQGWGENCVESVAHNKPRSISFRREITSEEWGSTQTRVEMEDRSDWINWLWAWENTNPSKNIIGIQFEPLDKDAIIISGISLGKVKSNPLRWNGRQKALLTIPVGTSFKPAYDKKGQLNNIRMDLGQVIFATPRLLYPEQDWPESYNNKLPKKSKTEYIIEYTAHPEALFYLSDKDVIPVSELTHAEKKNSLMQVIKSADRKVKIRIVEKSSGKVIPVKFHAHGEVGEYLAPVDRHRQPNYFWYSDFSVDFVHLGTHNTSYIPGETVIKMPLGKTYIEISKGFEIKPLRKIFEITPETELITIEIEKALSWREKGWVTADTHVHFLSPASAMLEGCAEGVNVVNLLASQWGELMTNVGDFDGKTTHGSKKYGGDGEYLVRVGTENRQHVMGHISLLGYEGNIIAPMTTGGPDESALGDPIEMLLTEWAKQCRKQHGIVVLPHFPDPRLESAAAIVSGDVDGVEMTSWGNLYGGIDPYSLTDWYRYLNCGYFVAAVGGTDKMDSGTAVGTIRTYTKVNTNTEFTYEAWKEGIRTGQTFVTYGPLIEFSVEGKPSGSQINMPPKGGTVNITWEVASVTVPMTRVELIVNGKIKETANITDWKGNGSWNINVPESSWIAILVRGKYPDKPEIIAAHSSPVMIKVNDSPMLIAEDAMTILDQIEGAMAYLDTIGTRADDIAYKRMKLVLISAQRAIHNRMHSMGYFHQHTPLYDHSEHH